MFLKINYRKAPVSESLFNEVAKKILQHRCFPVNIVKFLWTTFFTEDLWWLLLKYISIQYTWFTQGLLQLLFTFHLKPSKGAYHLHQFFISIEKSFWNLFITQSFLFKSFLKLIYYTIFFIAFEFVFILKHIFCLPQWLFFQMACLQVSS